MEKYKFTNKKNYLIYLKNSVFFFIFLLTYTTVNSQFSVNVVSLKGKSYGNFNFINEQIGFHFSEDQILKTIDGGNTWNVYSANLHTITKPDSHLSGYFLDENMGWIIIHKFHNNNINDSSFLYRTLDGGITWTLQRVNPPNTVAYAAATFGAVYFKNEYEGWIYGKGLLEHTTDGGTTWNTIIHHVGNTNHDDQITNFAIGSENNTYAIGFGAWILASKDGGTTWQTQNRDLWQPGGLDDDYFQYGIDFINADTGMIAAGHGVFKTTFDGGTTWNTGYNGYPHDNNSIAFIPNEQTVFMAGGSYCDHTGCYESASLMYSRDFGTTWNVLIDQLLDFRFVDIVWPSQHYGFISERTGVIYKIENLSPILPDTTSDTTLVNGIMNSPKNSISISPSPVRDQLKVSHNNIIKHIRIRNIHGQYLMDKALIENSISLSHFSKGLYFIEFYDSKDNLILSKKIIKE